MDVGVSEFSKAVEDAVAERGCVNILIAGRSGVGKSTLINAVFHADLAETGQGKPVTRCTREISRPGVPVRILDTRGLEMAQYKETIGELETLIKSRGQEEDTNRHIHAAWLCIQEDGRRVEDAEIELHEMLQAHVPVIGVITKARSDCGFRATVQNLLPHAKNVIRVRAIGETIDDDSGDAAEPLVLKPMGLEALVQLTDEVIPEGKRRALAAAQKASMKIKVNQCRKIIGAAATAAGAAGASPVPLSDAILIAPVQIGMIAGITSVFDVELNSSTITALVSSAAGVTGATFLGRAIVANTLKVIPGVGTLAGGAISATTAVTLTAVLGEAYLNVLVKIFQEDPDAKPSGAELGAKLKDYLMQG